MARNREPILKKCRLLGIDPIILGINKKSNRNIRENANKKPTEYAIQLREKQKLKFIYGMLEKPFFRYYEEASRKKGVTGELLLQFLERRLDNVAYRLGFAKTRRQSRQIVTHGHLQVNGQRIDIPSYRVKKGDVITIKGTSKELEVIKSGVSEASTPSWIEMDKTNYQAKIIELPKKENLDFEVNEQLIIEFYSR